MSTISCAVVSSYLESYYDEFRREYDRLTAPPPAGGGFPRVGDHPAFDNLEVQCFLGTDGCVICDESGAPEYEWRIAGGPALMIDQEPTRVPKEIIQILRDQGIYGKNIGIYRVVSKGQIPDDVWRGIFPPFQDISIRTTPYGKKISVRSYKMNLTSIIERLTFGVFGRALDLKLEHNREKFWTNHLISRMGFINADRTSHRFFRYFEICRHVDLAAWDQRSLWARIYVDVRKHLADQFSRPGEGGVFDINYEAPIFSKFNDRLEKLKTVIDNFDNLLQKDVNSDEYIFHKFLEENPILLDSYGMIDSKPRFEYPEGEGPLGKASVIPDFIIRLPGRRYKIVEIEKANKQIARADGVPSAKLTQPAFQIAEFKDYVKNYYYLLRDKYPGISTNCTYMLVMGRSVDDSVSEPSMEARRKDLLRQTFAVDEVYTYDDVLKNVRELYLRLSSIGGAAVS